VSGRVPIQTRNQSRRSFSRDGWCGRLGRRLLRTSDFNRPPHYLNWMVWRAGAVLRRPLTFSQAAPFHDLDVSVKLIGNPNPTAREIFKDRGFGFVLRQGQQTTAFFGLNPAMFCAVHCNFLA
jgi:hypothetical protein